MHGRGQGRNRDSPAPARDRTPSSPPPPGQARLRDRCRARRAGRQAGGRALTFRRKTKSQSREKQLIGAPLLPPRARSLSIGGERGPAAVPARRPELRQHPARQKRVTGRAACRGRPAGGSGRPGLGRTMASSLAWRLRQHQSRSAACPPRSSPILPRSSSSRMIEGFGGLSALLLPQARLRWPRLSAGARLCAAWRSVGTANETEPSPALARVE